MQIPTGDFGNAIARPGQLANIPRDDPIGQAQQRMGDIAMHVTLDNQQRQTDLQAKERNAQAALTLAKTSNAMHDAHTEVAQGVQDGTIPVAKANAELQTRLGKIRDTSLDGLLPDQRAVLDSHLEGTVGTLQRSLGGVVIKRQQHDVAAGIDDFGEQMGRFAVRNGPGMAVQNYASYVRSAGLSAGLDERAQGKLIQTFTEKTHADFFSSAATAALTNGDPEALRKVREQMAGPAGDAMDPQRRATLTHTMFGWEQSLLARQDREANKAEEYARKRYNEAVDVFNKGTDIALGGGYFSPEFIQQMTESAAGTEMAPRVASLVASQRTIAGFASRPAPERGAMLERLRAARATPGQGADPLDEKLLQAMSTMDEKLKRQAEENPWQAAQQAGVLQSAPTFSLTDPTTAVQTIQQRMQQISTVENWTGKRASPLQPQEVEQLSKFVRQMPIDQAGTMLANIGEALGDSERVAALAKQLHDKDGTLGLAMMYASAGTTQGRKVSELVLRGEQALKDKASTIDKAAETGWQASIAKQVRGAYSNREVENQVMDAAFKIAAANYADGKGVDLDNAVRLATGGIVERNGAKVPLPYGMSERDFDKRVEGFKPEDLASQVPDGKVYVGRTAIPLDQFVQGLPKATLVHAGQGIYNVRAGTALVTNAQGKRISLKVAP